MQTLRLADIAAHSSDAVVLARSRKLAATVALAFPLAFIALLLAGFVENGLESFFQHGVLVAALIPGILALILWYRRYWASALAALKSGHPVVLHDGCLRVNGSNFAVTPHLSLVYDNRSKLLVRDGGVVLARFPSFFIRIGEGSDRVPVRA
jgi:hypothetical protein